MAYWVIDVQTKEVRGTFQHMKQASRRADKLDNAYGAIRHQVRFVDPAAYGDCNTKGHYELHHESPICIGWHKR